MYVLVEFFSLSITPQTLKYLGGKPGDSLYMPPIPIAARCNIALDREPTGIYSIGY